MLFFYNLSTDHRPQTKDATDSSACQLSMSLVLAGGNKEAIAIAKACSLAFIRAEGYVFGHVADERYIDANAGALLRYRKTIEANDVQIFIDIKKKHSCVSHNNVKMLQTWANYLSRVTKRPTLSKAQELHPRLTSEEAGDWVVIQRDVEDNSNGDSSIKSVEDGDWVVIDCDVEDNSNSSIESVSSYDEFRQSVLSTSSHLSRTSSPSSLLSISIDTDESRNPWESVITIGKANSYQKPLHNF
ncbi:hypothetical protein WA026_013837 [Henosepilachna vigintioctopunctata]|uniref:Uncharacterized protein n=1 Tax=Henosepilachna vigintioctopunctata TaxID=420089 RepID=A0AAW1V1K7_9CUCU